tara:strand:- start:177 stop:1871 length:1695 start_codon:yes stop_codon:yes gene_type:complete
MSDFIIVKPEELGVTEDKYLGLLFDHVWQPNVVTYSFSDLGQWENFDLIPMNAVLAGDQIKDLATKVFDEIEAVTELKFSEVAADAHFDVFVNTKLLENGFAGDALRPVVNGGYASYAEQQPEIYALYHEILHAIGLNHPEDTFPNAYRSGQLTIMYPANASEYEGAYLYTSDPTGLLAHDIETLQQIYGVNQTSAGSNDYYFNTSVRSFEGLFDAGGTDTIHIQDELRKGVSLDLTPGGGMDVGSSYDGFNDSDSQIDFTVSETVFTTSTTVIENVKLAAGNDFVRGNDADNTLVGHGGDDTILGAEGNDTIWAGSDDGGDDHFFGGSGNDIIGGGAGNDKIAGDSGTDILFGGSGADSIWAGGEDDILDASADIVWAGAGNDIVQGAAGADTVGGGAGDDNIEAHAGNDKIFGGAGTSGGDDTLDGGSGNDEIFASVGTDILIGGSGNDTLYGGSGDDLLSGDAGQDFLYGGVGDDTLTGGNAGDTFGFSNAFGTDIVTDFGNDDFLDLSGIEGLTFSALLENARFESGNAELTFSGQGAITLVGIDQVALQGFIDAGQILV